MNLVIVVVVRNIKNVVWGNKMDGPVDLNKKRVIPEVTYSVVENLGWDAKDKKQRKIGEITQLQFLDLQDEIEDARAGIDVEEE